MKLTALQSTQEEFDFEFDDSTFRLKSLDDTQATSFTLFISGSAETMLNYAQIPKFVERNVIDWSGVETETGEQLPCTSESKKLLLSKGNESLLNAMITAAYMRHKEIDERAFEDRVAAKK